MKNKKIDKQLNSKKIRPTAMRELVLKVLMEESTAMSLADLEAKLITADKSTLFRTLKTFKDKKLIHSIDDGTGAMKYALCKNNCEVQHEDFHIHFLCTKCRKTYCLSESEFPTLSLPHGFSMQEMNVVVKGICVNCK